MTRLPKKRGISQDGEDKSLILRSFYFFLKPAGHFGAAPVTFLMTLPLMQVIVVFFIAGCVGGVGGVGGEIGRSTRLNSSHTRPSRMPSSA